MGITAAPDGNVYFTETSANKIGEVVLNTETGTPTQPTVVHVARFGFHNLPTALVLSFNKPLNPTSAQDPHNYKITNAQGLSIPIKSISYDPAALTVTIAPVVRLELHSTYRLTVIGKAPFGVRDTSGTPLHGGKRSDTNYTTIVTGKNLVLPAP